MAPFVLRTTDIWGMTVSNVMEEMNFRSGEEECCCYAVDRCVAPTFVEESTGFVEVVEVICVRFGSEKSHICNLKV
jgi:hypothetical protein